MLLLIALLPFLGFLANAAFGRRLSRAVSGGVACAALIGSFVLAVVAVLRLLALPPESRVIEERVYSWIASGAFRADFTLLLDPLSAMMILVVTGIGSLIHIYSTAYMHEETPPEYARYFSYLNLFAAFMLVLVLGSNFLVMFVGWEGVGLCSYLLIGFWFQKKSAADAGKKAFIVNRIGDFGFVLGVLLLWTAFGTIDFRGVAEMAAGYAPEETFGRLSLITLLLFIGATGKSAQIPLYVWLPDAMEGPTPVSALIHAATMVTAGVYMIGRNAVLFAHAPETLAIVAVGRRGHGPHGRHDRAGAERHQARARLFDRIPARLHVPGDGRRRVRRRHLPSLHPRIFQGAAVPRIRRGHSRARGRAGPPADGRAQSAAADHVLDVSRSAHSPSRACRDLPASSARTRSCSARSRTAIRCCGSSACSRRC